MPISIHNARSSASLHTKVFLLTIPSFPVTISFRLIAHIKENRPSFDIFDPHEDCEAGPGVSAESHRRQKSIAQHNVSVQSTKKDSQIKRLIISKEGKQYVPSGWDVGCRVSRRGLTSTSRSWAEESRPILVSPGLSNFENWNERLKRFQENPSNKERVKNRAEVVKAARPCG